MPARNRILPVLVAASYLLAVCASSLFHHHETHDEESSRPGFSASHAEDDHDCSICQFLAQKPAPAADVAAVEAGELVQAIATPSTLQSVGGLFTAWHSRAPPVFA